MTDFPRLSPEIMKDKFFLGTSLEKLILSNLSEFVNRDKVFVISNKMIKKIRDEDKRWSLLN